MKGSFAVLPLPAEPAPASPPVKDAPPPPAPQVNPFTLFLILILLLGATEQLAARPAREQANTPAPAGIV
ncbi:MAG: hypothetical protein PWQ41_1786 [Bacillota bacterium]|jgi:hypothetical protein|nr:hypothetical protein [Bacillota bacterium]MDK2856292.1 hypothetical protein [Bacillota bacterium]MDK2926012.1 hypothetical protein [Bacillota bacterium]